MNFKACLSEVCKKEGSYRVEYKGEYWCGMNHFYSSEVCDLMGELGLVGCMMLNKCGYKKEGEEID